MFDKEYFLTRLANGEDMNVIGQEVADAMNAALAEHIAKAEAEKAAAAARAAEAEKEAAKRDLIEEMIDIIKELAILEGVDEDELVISDEEVDGLVKAFNEMFAMMREVKKLASMLEAKEQVHPAVKRPANAPSDDQILADFLKMFN